MSRSSVAVAKYVAVLSPDVCAIHNWSDGSNLLQRVFSLDIHTVAATRCFSTQKGALCWLTDPVHTNAVCDAAARRCPSPPPNSCAPLWAALVTPASTSSFQLNEHGLAMALTILRDPLSGTCVVRRFASSSNASAWLASPAGGTLLEVIGWSSLALPSCQGAGVGVLASVASECSGTPHDRAATATSLVSTRTPPSVCRPPPTPSTRAGRPAPPRHQGASPPARGCPSSGRKRPAGGSVGGEGARESARPWCAGSWADNDAAAFEDDARVQDVVDREAAVGESLRVENDTVRAEERQVQERPVPHQSKRQRTFRRMPCEPPDQLNPPSMDRETMGPSLSRANIRRFMAQHHAEWKESQVSGAPANTSRRSQSSGAPPSPRPPRPPPAAPDLPCPQPGGLLGRPRDHAGGAQWCPTSAADADAASSTVAAARPTTSAAPENTASSTTAAANRATSAPTNGAAPGAIGRLAADGQWDAVCKKLVSRNTGTFVSGGPGVGKSTFLKRLNVFLKGHFTAAGEVVVIAPTGTSAKTAGGCTYHSFFGFGREYKPLVTDPAEEAAQLLSSKRYTPIKKRLAVVRAVLLDEISLVSAVNLDVMFHLLRLSRPVDAPPSLWFAFGDFLQLRPVLGAWAFTGKTWSTIFGDALLELTVVHRQTDPGFIQAVHDARLGRCSKPILDLVKARTVEGELYTSLKSTVLHLMPRQVDVSVHNRECLELLCNQAPPTVTNAVDIAIFDIDRDTTKKLPVLAAISSMTIRAALMDCVAPPSIAHCLRARVMITTNRMSSLGVTHGSTGFIVKYGLEGEPIVRLEDHRLPAGVERGASGLHDAGDDWVEVLCGPVPFTARILAHPGALAERTQLPFVLGWATTIHMSQSLTISAAVVDLELAFEAGMVHTALGRVPSKERLHIKSFSAGRLFADPVALRVYEEWRRL